MDKISTRAAYFNLCLLLIIGTKSFAQSPCDQTQVTLSTQADVNSFPSQYCSTLCSLTISGNDITNLDSLYVLTKVGTLTIHYNPSLANVAGLSNITRIESPCGSGGLRIEGNHLLSDVGGFSSLTYIDGGLTLTSNTMLSNLDGFSNLNTLTGSQYGLGLGISSNASLDNIDGLALLTSISGDVEVSGNPGLADLNGLAALTSIGGYLIISSNDAVTTLDGLASLESVGGFLTLEQNPNLISIHGLSKLTYIGQFSASGMSLTVANNDVLASLDGLQGLDTIAGLTFIDGNESLLDLDGLSSLNATSYSGRSTYNSGIRISGNNSLRDISGLGGIAIIDGGRASYLEITSNPSLQSIDLPSLKTISGFLGSSLTIKNNGDLLNLDGLSSLETINGGMSAVVSITGNESLQNIDGLSQLVRVATSKDFTISNNLNLGRFCGLYNLFHSKGIGCGSPQCYSTAYVHIEGNERNPTPEQIEAEGPCDALMTQPTALVFSQVTSEGMKVGFRNSTTFTSGYLVLMKSHGQPAPEDVPQDGVSYNVGQVLGSSSIVVHASSDTTFTVSGLVPSTEYFYDVFSWKTTEDGNDYLVATPLEGSKSTMAPSDTATSLVFTNVTSESMTVSLDNAEPGSYMALMKAFGYPSPNDVPVNGREYRVGNTIGSSTIVVNIGNGSEFTVNGLMPGVTYYFDIYKYESSGFVYDAQPGHGNQMTENGSPDARIAGDDKLQPYPNPFESTTSIPFVVEQAGTTVQVAIYDMTGREVGVLLSGSYDPGRHEASWDGADRSGRRVNPGMYVYSVRSEKGVVTGRVAVR